MGDVLKNQAGDNAELVQAQEALCEGYETLLKAVKRLRADQDTSQSAAEERKVEEDEQERYAANMHDVRRWVR